MGGSWVGVGGSSGVLPLGQHIGLTGQLAHQDGLHSPVINPVCQCTYVPTNILHVVASHGHDNVLFVALPRLLQEHLEDLALYVV